MRLQLYFSNKRFLKILTFQNAVLKIFVLHPEMSFLAATPNFADQEISKNC